MFELRFLTDKEIIEQAEGKEVLNPKDIYLKTSNAAGHRGGLYDALIFGNLGSCICQGTKFRHDGVCPICRVKVYTKAKEYMKVSAFFRLSIPVIFPYKLTKLVKKLIGMGVPLKKARPYPYELLRVIWGSEFIISEVRKSDPDAFLKKDSKFYKLNINYGIDDNTVVENIGVLGLLKLKDYSLADGSDNFSFLDRYINSVISVNSPFFRPYSVTVINNEKRANIPEETSNYKAIISFSQMLPTVVSEYQDAPIDQATVMFNFNWLITKIMNESELLQTSRQSLVRNLVGVRVSKSGRANIIPDLDLTMDQVRIPRSLAYEALNGDIIREVQKRLTDDAGEAKRLYFNPTPAVMEIFEEVVANSIVLLLRNPTLYKFNLLAMRPLLSDDPAIGIPIDVCKAYNADPSSISKTRSA